MRRRIVRTTASVAGITLVVFCMVVSALAAARIATSEREDARAEANRVAAGLSMSIEAAASGDGRDADELGSNLERFRGYLQPGERITVTMPSGATFSVGVESGEQRVVAKSSGYPVEVTVYQRGDNFMTALLEVGAVVLVVGIIVFVLAVVTARRLADRLTAPLADLSAAAARLGQGEARPAKLRWGIEELDAVSAVLDVSAERIGEQLAAERRLAGDLSHQLRSPLTALSMRLEEVLATRDPDVARAEATIALQQVERLSHVVDDIMAFARHAPGEQTDVDIDAVLAQQQDEWTPAFRSAGRDLRRSGAPGLVARGSTSGLAQVVSTLVENSLIHGSGNTTLHTRVSGEWSVIEVGDEGTGVEAHLVGRIFDRAFSGASRSGLGLSVARALTEVEGGRLELTRRTPPTFTVFLAAPASHEQPAVEQPAVEQPDAQADSDRPAGG